MSRQVWRVYSVSLSGKCRNIVPPQIRGDGPTVQQEHRLAVNGARLKDAKFEVIGKRDSAGQNIRVACGKPLCGRETPGVQFK